MNFNFRVSILIRFSEIALLLANWDLSNSKATLNYKFKKTISSTLVSLYFCVTYSIIELLYLFDLHVYIDLFHYLILEKLYSLHLKQWYISIRQGFTKFVNSLRQHLILVCLINTYMKQLDILFENISCYINILYKITKNM